MTALQQQIKRNRIGEALLLLAEAGERRQRRLAEEAAKQTAEAKSLDSSAASAVHATPAKDAR